MLVRKKKPKGFTGFTLVELMIVVAIVAILVALAYPSYAEYVDRARRADAKTALLDVHLAQGKWRASDTDYGTLAEISEAAISPDGYYDIALTVRTTTAFTATAVPKAGTAQAGDSCGTFTITQAGPDVSTAAKEKCWDR